MTITFINDKRRRKNFTCKNGHNIILVGLNKQNQCKVCRKNAIYRWAKKRPGIYAKYSKKWRFNNPLKSYHNDREKHWKRQQILNEGGEVFKYIDFDRLYQLQQGRCFLCKTHQSSLKKSLSVDHDHKTGKVRGLLCGPCNTSLGFYEYNKQNYDHYLSRGACHSK